MSRSAGDARVRPWSGRRRIVWLASYPRSGNTWTRALLANLLSAADEPVSVNRIAVGADLDSYDREEFEEWTGASSGSCTDDEADLLRPAFHRARAARADAHRPGEGGRPLFGRVHDAFHRNRAGEWLFPDDATAGAVYVLRNPLDVAVSWAFFSGREDFARSIAMLNDCGACLAGRGALQLRQRLLDWSGHVRSWTAAPFPVLVVRYEDLLADTVGQLRGIVRFLRLEGAADEGRLRRAAAFSSFARLREREDREGFRGHRWNHRHPFFRSGKSGVWRRHLTPAQARLVVHAHAGTMAAFGYDVSSSPSDPPLQGTRGREAPTPMRCAPCSPFHSGGAA